MSWYDAQALHIYAPPDEPFGRNWVEQILGEVVKPIIQKYGEHVPWVWGTRYSNTYKEDDPPRGYPLPDAFHADGRYRFIVLRLHAPPEIRADLHSESIEMAQSAGCFTEPDGWVPYDPVHDLGGDRFIRNDASLEDRRQRARLVASFVDATIRLMLDSLTYDEAGKWNLEPNMLPKENRKGSFFESVHHLFCNATGVPTTILLGGKCSSLQIKTYWMKKPIVCAGDETREFKVEVPIKY